jgi:hypothetical protein
MWGSDRRQWWTWALLALFVAGWAALFFLVDPDRLAERLGEENSYLVVLVLSVIGAIGSMTTFTSYPAIVTFAAGDLSPWLLGLVSGVGLTIGDAIFYYVFSEFRLRGGAKEKAEAVGAWLEERPGWVIPVVTYVWVGMLPIANNILTGALALSGYSFRRLLAPLFLGNVTFPTAVAWLASRGIEILG